MSAVHHDPGFLTAWGAAWSAADPDDLLALFAPDGVYTDVGSDLAFTGHDEIARFHRFMQRFCPDGDIVFHELHGDAGGFAATWTWSGTAAGPLRIRDRTWPAAGGRFSVPGVAFCTTAPDGTIATHRDFWDVHDVLLQLDLA